jgi:hypothetical protein
MFFSICVCLSWAITRRNIYNDSSRVFFVVQQNMGQTWPRDHLRTVHHDNKQSMKGLEGEVCLYDHWRLDPNQRSHNHMVYYSSSPPGTQYPPHAVEQGIQLRGLTRWMDRDYRQRVKAGQSISHCQPIIVPLGEHQDYNGGIEVKVGHYGAGYVCGRYAYTFKEMNEKFGMVQKEKKTEEPKDWARCDEREELTASGIRVINRSFLSESPPDRGYYILTQYLPERRVWSYTPCHPSSF